ncbi:calmodulin-binding receptor-like cytoplasmic kinase 3 [Iris pallida]|uniref:non-specific serine/threonine protein kinase n=1 Tax=Iris pallida TaxID=29817 RepID=A0AAX6I777_IRIPA|nr:calmodulin-binding receptor-like cytoplasmic kinase 3 [Iris pallida]
MARAVLVLLLLVPILSISVLAAGAERRTRIGICGLDRVAVVESSESVYFSVNRRRVDGPDLVCRALGFYFGSGCFAGDREWARIGKRCCDRGFGVANGEDFVRSVGRKLLMQPKTNASIPGDSSKRGQAEEENSWLPNKIYLAIPGIFLVCFSLICPCFRTKKKDASAHNTMSTETNLMDAVSTFDVSSSSDKAPATPLRIPPSPSRFAMSPQLNRIGSMHLSVNQIVKATHNFSTSLKLGEGGFGTVYKAVLPDGQVIAIKRAKKESFSSLRDEFSNEVELLAKIDHRNLVRLLGYTDKGNERIIITEYVPNGTLREHLDGQHGKVLDFNQRLEISIDVAHALTYLHLYAEKPIIHRDVKSSNILLTESFRAKVSDFGFARIGPTEAEQTHILTKVKGTAGYLDPEYLRTYKLTPKSDVFSFGILLIEILTARRPVEMKRHPNERVTIRWAFKNYNEGNVMTIVDPMLKEAVDGEVVMRMLSLAFQCAAPTRADRPSMKEVGEQLWEIRKDYGRSRSRGN